MSSPTFESQVLTHLDTINGRLDTINGRLDTIDGSLKDIELKVSGVNGDPHNRGISGALANMATEVDAIDKKQRRVTDDIRRVQGEQKKQKAWNKGAAAGAGANAVGVAAVLAKLSGAF